MDARYKFLRDRHGGGRAMANGYRLDGFFVREQELLLGAIDRNNGPFLDVACGSGLMLAPLLAERRAVFGVDFNGDACAAAAENGIFIVRGDAYSLPFADKSIGQIVNCQFLNQQPPEKAPRFITECARVLKPGGRALLLWRNARSLIHRGAHAAFSICDAFTGQPSFPQYAHSVEEIGRHAQAAGLVVRREAVTLPFSTWKTVPVNSISAHIIGASLFAVFEKP